MKNLLKMFAGKATRKNTQSISVVRMQSLGALKIYLDLLFGVPTTLTQVDMSVTPIEEDAAGAHCDVMLEAFFYGKGMEKRYGDETRGAPLPPKVTGSIRFRTDSPQVLCWETVEMNAHIENIQLPSLYGTEEFDIRLCEGLDKFDHEFGAHRPWGLPIVPKCHDKVSWSI